MIDRVVKGQHEQSVNFCSGKENNHGCLLKGACADRIEEQVHASFCRS